jgi:CRISPR-associated protein Csa2
MFLSFGIRFLANVEALNMVESVGNLSKHRRAPIIVPTESGFKLVYVPAISGESIGHAYQQALVDTSQNIYGIEKAPLDDWSLRGEFFKFGDTKHMPQQLKELLENEKVNKKDLPNIIEFKHNIEKEAIKCSIIVDVGGFLLAGVVPVRRTSLFQVGYAIPVYDELKNTVIESQFHVRQVVSESIKTNEMETSQVGNVQKNVREAQMIYYVEAASAIYGLTFNLNLDGIGRTSMVRAEDVVNNDERMRRVKAAILALATMLSNMNFGGKRSRYLPIEEILTMVVVISRKKPFIVSPPQWRSFPEDTARRLEAYRQLLAKLNMEFFVDGIAFSKEVELPAIFQKVSSTEELFAKLVEKVFS